MSERFLSSSWGWRCSRIVPGWCGVTFGWRLACWIKPLVAGLNVYFSYSYAADFVLCFVDLYSNKILSDSWTVSSIFSIKGNGKKHPQELKVETVLFPSCVRIYDNYGAGEIWRMPETCRIVCVWTSGPTCGLFLQPHLQCLLRDVEAVSCVGLVGFVHMWVWGQVHSRVCVFLGSHVECWVSAELLLFLFLDETDGERHGDGRSRVTKSVLFHFIILSLWHTEVVKWGLSHCTQCAYTVWGQRCQTLS